MLVFRGFAGSYLYGLQDKNSDLDIIEIYIPKIEEEINLKTNKLNPIQTITEDKDVTKYDIASFLRALNKGSIQLIEILFSEEFSIVHNSYIFELLQEFKYKLISEEHIRKNINGFVKNRFDNIFKSLNIKTKLYIIMQNYLENSGENLIDLLKIVDNEQHKNIIVEYLQSNKNDYCINILFKCEKDIDVRQDLIKYDHKSMYQVIRVLYTIQNLLKNGEAFPYSNDLKKHLLNIKSGNVSFLDAYYEVLYLIRVLNENDLSQSHIFSNEDKSEYINKIYQAITKTEFFYGKFGKLIPTQIKKYILKKVFIKEGVEIE